jgi:predicted phage baseplate assembly protein
VNMPLPNLDDRRFQDLVDEAKRLIPRYLPEWTNHNVADPGVALIELFAWLTELTLFRINQVPDRLFASFLDLFGVAPYPAAAARTDVTFWLSTVVDDTVVVPAGTQVSTVDHDGDRPVIFQTEDDLRIDQPEHIAFLTSSGPDRYVDRWEEFRYDRGRVRCFTSDPITPGDCFLLGFAGSLSGNVVQLSIDATIEGLGVDPLQPPLAWEIWSGSLWIPVRVIRDGTGGLNRQGDVVLALPLAQAPLTLSGTRAWWIRGRMLQPEVGQPPYRASPEIRTLTAVSLGGAVPAHHGEPVGAEVLGRSDGRPAQRFNVARFPLLPRLAEEHVVVEHVGIPTRWEEVADFSRSGPNDHHVTWSSSTGEIEFGPAIRYPDGTVVQHGAIPPEGAVVSVSGYRLGGGTRGNVGVGQLSALRSAIPYIDRVENHERATGGVDPETIENAKLRGPLWLNTGQRAVTAPDFERLAMEAAPDVARARCLEPAYPGGPVRLLVVPRVDVAPEALDLDDLAIPDDLLTRVAEFLDERRLLGTTVELGTPFYQGVTVATRLIAHAGRQLEQVRQTALEALYRHVNPIVGGASGAGWSFDTDLVAGGVFQLLSALDGVARVDEVLLFEADVRNQVRIGRAVERVRLNPESLFLSFRHQVLVR